jgi:hypothetical protein
MDDDPDKGGGACIMTEAVDDRAWLVPLPADYRRCGLSRTARDVMHAVCSFARTKPYAWMSNEQLAEVSGLPLGSVKAGLRELAREKWIYRPMEECRRTRRFGVILLRRPDGPIHPVADDGPRYASTLEALRRDRAAWEASLRPRRFRRAGAAGAAPN